MHNVSALGVTYPVERSRFKSRRKKIIQVNRTNIRKDESTGLPNALDETSLRDKLGRLAGAGAKVESFPTLQSIRFQSGIDRARRITQGSRRKQNEDCQRSDGSFWQNEIFYCPRHRQNGKCD